jgi:outer membrane protein, heavy metal efflux system
MACQGVARLWARASRAGACGTGGRCRRSGWGIRVRKRLRCGASWRATARALQCGQRSLVIGCAVLLIGAPAALAAAQEALPADVPDPLTLAWCLARAGQGNPEIAVDEAAAEAASHRVGPAGALEDPRFAYSAVNIPVGRWSFDSTPMSGQQLELRQKLPFPGLLGSREAAARAAAEAQQESVEDRRRRIAAAVEQSWAELGYAQRALEITNTNIDLLRQIAQIAEAKYRVGQGLQQDVMRAQVELTLLLDERLRREAVVRTQEAQLAALLALPLSAPLPRTAALRDDTPIPALEALLEQLPESSPRLRALAKQVEEAEREQRAVALEGYPDFDLGIGYRIRNAAPGDPVAGDDFVSGGVTLRLPVDRGKWREKVAESDALLRRAKASRRVALEQLRSTVRAAFAALQRSDATVALLETGLVPQTRQSLEASRSGYEVDKVDFLSLLDSQVKYVDAELGLVRAVADRRVAFAALESSMGKELR